MGHGEVRDVTPAPSGPAPRFRAFVSYSHADAAEAKRLQKRLETYRIPRRLAARLAPFAGERARVGPIFRDQEDLSASADLSDAVKRAIERSDALIVLCSPDATKSRWVAREIALFRAIHPHRPILAVLIAGDLAQCFPASLLAGGMEPLAADLRRSGDGPRLGFLKIVAGILGLPLDELIQRDAQRRLRRVTGITVAALALMLVLAAMTLLALSGRREAERQRGEAEALVEYMLTDLRQRLRAVGRLDIMIDVNRRALDYYREQGSPENLPEESLDRRARIIGAMGEDAENRGELEVARSRYVELHRTTNALLGRRPGDAARVFAHARSENRLALLAVVRRRLGEAETRFRRTQSLLRSIEAWGRDRPGWLRLTGYAHGNVCATSLERGTVDGEVLRDCQRAVAYAERLVAIAPGDAGAVYDLVFHCLWLAEAQTAIGDRRQALATRTRYLELVAALVARDPGNMLWLEQQMEVYVRHAEFLRAAQDLAGARRFLTEARGINEKLILRDPGNAVWAGYKARIARAIDGEKKP